MSIFYRVLYQIGFAPWEGGLAQSAVAEQIAAMFTREEDGRERPHGRALDLGCGSGIHAVALARRGCQVTAIDSVPKALARARERATQAGVEVRFLRGDVTALQAAEIGTGFQLVLDFGTVHGLTQTQRAAVGRGVSAVATDDATLLMLSFTTGRRGPLPRGMSREDIEATYPGWRVTDEAPVRGQLPGLLKELHADSHWYRLRRG
jgi:SAM-dependent methyltransferase